MARPRSEIDQTQADVAAYVAVGADESVQRIITAVHRLSKRLNQWYDRQLADLDVSTGEWTVLQELAREPAPGAITPSRLAAAASVAPSSMTHRLDRMVERGLVTRGPTRTTAPGF
ncbi:MAG: MarR family winged helix-turn-helix transcriptional regulator [Propionibacteriaceae bacterium]